MNNSIYYETISKGPLLFYHKLENLSLFEYINPLYKEETLNKIINTFNHQYLYDEFTFHFFAHHSIYRENVSYNNFYEILKPIFEKTFQKSVNLSYKDNISLLDDDNKKVVISVEINDNIFSDIISDDMYVDTKKIFAFMHTILNFFGNDRYWFYIGSCEVSNYYLIGSQSYIDTLLENGLLKYAWKADDTPSRLPISLDDLPDDLPF